MTNEFREIKKTNIPNVLEKIEKLEKSTHFSRKEVIKLLQLFKELKGDRAKMTRKVLLKFLFEQFDFCDEFLNDIICRVVNNSSDTQLSAEEFVSCLSLLLRGSLEEKIAFCFNVYDINNKLFISRADLGPLMRKAILKNSSEDDPEEFMKELIEMTFKKLDLNGLHKIVASDYFTMVQRQPELLQALGQILPDEMQIKAFEMAYLGIKCYSPP